MFKKVFAFTLLTLAVLAFTALRLTGTAFASSDDLDQAGAASPSAEDFKFSGALQDLTADSFTVNGVLFRYDGVTRLETVLTAGQPVLVEAIALRELQSEQRLIETKLAAALQVSRVPIREAMRILESQGIIVASPRRGMRVATLDEAWAKQLHAVRAAIERIGQLREAAGRADEGFAVGVLCEPVRLGDPVTDQPSYALGGSADHVAERLGRYAERGINQLQLSFLASSVEDYCNQLLRFGAEVAPHFPRQPAPPADPTR